MALFEIEGFLEHGQKGFPSTCFIFNWLIGSVLKKKHQYLTLYRNWNRTPVYFELAVSASYLIFHYFFFNFCQGILISITSRSDIAINQSFVKNTEGTYEQSIICREHRKNYFVSSIEIPSSRLNPLLWTGATHYSPDTTDETIGVVVMIVIIVIIEVILMILHSNHLTQHTRQ